MAKLRKEMSVQSKPEHCSVIGSYLELQISDLGPFYMDGKLRHRPTTFIWTPRSKKAVFKPKLLEQRRSPKLSCSPDTIQCSTHILSSRSLNDLIFFWKAETMSQNIPEDSGQIMMLAMTYCLDKEIRIVTKSRCGHPLINQSTNQ